MHGILLNPFYYAGVGTRDAYYYIFSPLGLLSPPPAAPTATRQPHPRVPSQPRLGSLPSPETLRPPRARRTIRFR